MEYLNGQDCSLLLTATGERVPRAGPGIGSFLGPAFPWAEAQEGTAVRRWEGSEGEGSSQAAGSRDQGRQGLRTVSASGTRSSLPGKAPEPLSTQPPRSP